MQNLWSGPGKNRTSAIILDVKLENHQEKQAELLAQKILEQSAGAQFNIYFQHPNQKFSASSVTRPQLDHYFQQIGPVLMDFENDGGAAILKVERPPAF